MSRNLVLEFIMPSAHCNCNGDFEVAVARVNGKRAGTFEFCRCGNGCGGTDKMALFRHFKVVYPYEEVEE